MQRKYNTIISQLKKLGYTNHCVDHYQAMESTTLKLCYHCKELSVLLAKHYRDATTWYHGNALQAKFRGNSIKNPKATAISFCRKGKKVKVVGAPRIALVVEIRFLDTWKEIIRKGFIQRLTTP